MKYRKLPVEIEAIQYTIDNKDAVFDFCKDIKERFICVENNELYIYTLEGKMRVYKYDYIIKGVANEFYPCHPTIFEQTYEAVE